uniref:hypothetical protein n=1 Tax=Algoriphagus sp. TaxID=1872435 RepID=UPI004048C4E9
MEENDQTEKIIFQNIENTHIVQLVEGKETSKGSTWLVDTAEKEYYASQNLVAQNEEIFQRLEFGLNKYWALVQNVVWNGGEWSGKNISSLIMISFEKSDCELFKKTLKEHWELKFDAVSKIDQAIRMISNDPYNKVTDQLILESERIKEMAKNKEAELSAICRGWEDIER